MLVSDGLHNLLGGFAVAGAFIADVRLGVGASASDLVPEVKEDRDWRANALHFGCLAAGIALLYVLRVALEG